MPFGGIDHTTNALYLIKEHVSNSLEGLLRTGYLLIAYNSLAYESSQYFGFLRLLFVAYLGWNIACGKM